MCLSEEDEERRVAAGSRVSEGLVRRAATPPLPNYRTGLGCR